MGKYTLVVALLVGLSNSAFARDDGRYANDPLKYWFDHLASDKGMCCSFADGFSVSDVDWDMHNGHYRVLLHGEWIDVPDTAVVTGPKLMPPKRFRGRVRQVLVGTLAALPILLVIAVLFLRHPESLS